MIGAFDRVPLTPDDDAALAPFVEAVTRQLAAGGADAADAWEEVRWCVALARAGDHDACVESLLGDVPLLSACYQNADLLPTLESGTAGALAQAVLDATHRLAG